MVKIVKVLFYARKVSSGMGLLGISQIFRGLALPSSPKNTKKGGQRRSGGGQKFTFFSAK